MRRQRRRRSFDLGRPDGCTRIGKASYNSSFYGPPLATTSSNWVRRVADNVNFRFRLYPLVVEVRHKSWLVPDFLRTLE
ncbi:MAG TPA: hypothetical protein VGQ98_08700 [Gemmatimonadaceae bacterium]|nr:hypothetical protein [Gemmatimonadaceae bacterium]